MKLDDLYGGLDKGLLAECATYAASYEGGHRYPFTTIATSRDYDPATDDTTTQGQTRN